MKTIKMAKVFSVLFFVVMAFGMISCAPKEESVAVSVPTDSNGVPLAGEDLTWGLKPFEERQTISIGFFTGSPLSYPYLFADKLGVLDALNIDVEYLTFTNGPAMMEANSEWDIASCGLGGVAIGLTGYDFKLIDINDSEENMAIFARADSPIAKDPTNPDVWRDASCIYPAGTTAQAVLAQYLTRIGLSLADIESISMDNANGLTAYNANTGDVLVCWNAIALAAEDAGHTRITDSGQLGMPFPCGTFAQPALLEDNFELATVITAVFHKTVEWLYESDENLRISAEWYLEHCDEEGFLANADIAQRTMEWYRGDTVEEYVELFTETSPDEAGIFTERELLAAEIDILRGFDFFVGQGNYTPEERAEFLEVRKVDNSVAKAVDALIN